MNTLSPKQLVSWSLKAVRNNWNLVVSEQIVGDHNVVVTWSYANGATNKQYFVVSHVAKLQEFCNANGITYRPATARDVWASIA